MALEAILFGLSSCWFELPFIPLPPSPGARCVWAPGLAPAYQGRGGRQAAGHHE